MGNDHGEIKRILIFGNGKLHKTFLREIREGDYLIGVDRAAYWLLENKIVPSAAIGDFDSTTPEEFAFITKSIRIVKSYKPEKDQTDMELAVTFAETMGVPEIVLFGATGTRVDHMLATLNLLNTQTVVDTHNRIRVIGRGKTVIQRASYKYLSIIPYTKSISVSLTGFRYETARKQLKKGSTLGVSNEISGDSGVIHIHSGRAWVIESKD